MPTCEQCKHSQPLWDKSTINHWDVYCEKHDTVEGLKTWRRNPLTRIEHVVYLPALKCFEKPHR